MSPLDYDILMEATFDVLYAGTSRRQAVVAALPSPAGEALAGAFGPGFDQDVVRRRTRLSADLLAALPVSFHAYYAQGGPAALESLFDSHEWRHRRLVAGALFPDPGSAVRAFVAFAGRTWIRSQAAWLRDAFRYEAQVCRASAGLAPCARPDLPHLPAQAWVSEATIDVPEVAAELSRRSREVPWDEALRLVKPRPVALATVSIPLAERVRQVHLRDDEVDALRWAWTEAAPVPSPSSPAWSTMERAVRAGILT